MTGVGTEGSTVVAAPSHPPALTSAEYSPRLWPATAAGVIPSARNTSRTAMLTRKIAGWVFCGLTVTVPDDVCPETTGRCCGAGVA